MTSSPRHDGTPTESTRPTGTNWLITGGCGFIGTALATRLLNAGGNNIRIYDNLSVGDRSSLEAICGPFVELDQSEYGRPGGDEVGSGGSGPSGWHHQLALVVGDVKDADAFAKASAGADVIVHLAANTGVGPSVENPMADCETNVLGVLNGLEAARANNVSRFVFASSGAPLGVQTPPLHEELAPHPASPYGASKLAGEGYCSAYFHCFGVETVALRFGNVYGPGSTHKSSVVAKFIKQTMAGERLEIYGDGSQTRDFIYLDDLIGAVVAAGTRVGVGGEVFQIATNAETTVNQMCRQLFDAFIELELELPAVDFGPVRQGDVQRNFSDTSKAERLLGWTSTTTLDQGLLKTVQSFLPDDHRIAGEPVGAGR